jgi:hypothetical protein
LESFGFSASCALPTRRRRLHSPLSIGVLWPIGDVASMSSDGADGVWWQVRGVRKAGYEESAHGGDVGARRRPLGRGPWWESMGCGCVRSCARLPPRSPRCCCQTVSSRSKTRHSEAALPAGGALRGSGESEPATRPADCGSTGAGGVCCVAGGLRAGPGAFNGAAAFPRLLGCVRGGDTAGIIGAASARRIARAADGACADLRREMHFAVGATAGRRCAR